MFIAWELKLRKQKMRKEAEWTMRGQLSDAP